MTDEGSRSLRKRFDGILDEVELARARESGTPLAFCPVQIGWVPLASLDDGEAAAPLSWQTARNPLHKRIDGTPVYPMPARITLRAWTEDDLPRYSGLLRDPGLWTFMLETQPGLLDDDTLRALIALSAERTHHIVYAAVHSGQPIGQVRLEFGPDRTGGELSYWLGAPARGKGLGAQMVRQFLTHLDSRHPTLTRITARVHPRNEASRRLLLSCGFARCDRGTLGLAPRGRDPGDWDGFLRQRP